MKRWLPIILLASLWAVVLTILFTPETHYNHGYPHPQFREMDVGGSGLARHESVLFAGWILGSVIIALFVSLLAWGTVDQPSLSINTNPTSKRYLRWGVFILGGLLYEGVFALLYWTYGASLKHPHSAPFWGPFPEPTSWLIFGVWFVPLFFILLYVVFFEKWVLPPKHLQRFEQLVKESKKGLSID